MSMYNHLNDKLIRMTDDEVKAVWDALGKATYNFNEPMEGSATMGDWTEMVYSEMTKRGLPCL